MRSLRLRHPWLRLLALPCLLGTAHAQERPATAPTRDVDVTYEMMGGDADGHVKMLTQRMRWAPAEGLLRVDPPSPGLYVIQQSHEHHLLAVREDNHTVMLMQADGAALAPGLGRASSFERLGTATVAGLDCTEWHTSDSGGQPTTVCLTADGVLLRARVEQRVLVQATQVTYQAADPSVFALPQGYQVVRPPR